MAAIDKISNFKSHYLLGYQIFLEEIKGRMKSLNILEPDLVPLLVMNNVTKKKKVITVPRFTSLWKLRAVITS
jgi:hypothetical protein